MKHSGTPPRSSTYELQFEHVTPDGATVGASVERASRAAVPEAEVIEILQRFASIPAVQMLEFEPQIIMRGPDANLQIRPHRGRLLVCDLRSADRVWRDVSPTGLQDLLLADTRSNAGNAPSAPDLELDPLLTPNRVRQWSLALLALGLALNGYALVSILMPRPNADFVPAGDGRPPRDVLEWITGSYAAAPPATFARIELQPPNIVVFHEAQTGQTKTDSYLFGSYKGLPRLITGQNGFIDLADRRWIEFAGRRYEREPAKP